MRKTLRHPSLVLVSFGFLLAMSFFAGCGDDSPVGPDDPNPTPIGSNMSFDRLGVALTPGGTEVVDVRSLDGDLEPFTVMSSDEAVATVTGGVQNAARGTAGSISVTGVGHGKATISVLTESGDKREFPVTVYDPTVIDAGEFLIKFTDQFGDRWNDSGSGADNDGDFYHPIPPEGYHALGSIGFRWYRNPADLESAVVVVKDKGTNTENPPLAPPVDFEFIWHNGIYWPIGGVGWIPDGNYRGAFWRPIPPEGYVALGDVVHTWLSGQVDPALQKPPLDRMMCVREDLTRIAGIGEYVWHDAGNGLSGRWFRADQLVVPDVYSDYEQMHIAPGTFAGQASHAQIDIGHPSARVLCIKPQILIDADYQSTLWRPALTNLEDPGNATQPLRNRTILVPFTAFADAGRDINWKVANSPFYVLERTYYWAEECFTSGLGSCSISYTTGSTESSERTSWQAESVTASWEIGFSFKGLGGKISSTVTRTLGFAESIGVSEFEEKTVSNEVPAPGEGAILATWKAANRFRLYRHNGLAYEPVVAPWTMFEDAFHSSRYP